MHLDEHELPAYIVGQEHPPHLHLQKKIGLFNKLVCISNVSRECTSVEYWEPLTIMYFYKNSKIEKTVTEKI